MRSLAKSLVLAVFLSTTWPVGYHLAQSSERPAVPTEQELEQVYKEAKTFYELEFKQSRSETDRKSLAEKLRHDAVNTVGDAVGQYALLRLAQDLAIENGDLELTLSVADAIASTFSISNAQARSDALVRLVKARK